MLGLALGLMAKPTLVTLPFTLLLLDAWPLGRLAPRTPSGSDRPSDAPRDAGRDALSTWWRLVVEKVPLLLLSLAGCAITLLAHANLHNSPTFQQLPLDTRVAHTLVAYCRYLSKALWPADLAVFYPYGPAPAAWQALGALLLLVAVTWATIRSRRRSPYLAVGWFWFLGTLVPVIGLIQVGDQGMADRFMYVPLIGLAVAVAWGLANWLGTRPGWRLWVAPLVGAGLAGYATAAAVQVRYWQSTESLMRHALAVTADNFVAHGNLGAALAAERRFDEAIEQFETGLRLLPRSADLHYNLGWTLTLSGRFTNAEPHYRAALDLRPDHAPTHTGLAQVLLAQDRRAEAVAHLEEAIRLQPSAPGGRLLLGLVRLQENRLADAAAQFEAVLRFQPADPVAHRHLGDVRRAEGRPSDAILHYRAALRSQPDSPEVLNNLAWLLAASPQAELRDGAMAVTCARRACELTGNKTPVLLGTLAAALAEAGHFADAVSAAEQAITLATAAGQTNVVAENQKLVALYRAGQPYHEPAVVSPKTTDAGPAR
jgi:tetratricopeptide (TPR) repeat protein